MICVIAIFSTESCISNPSVMSVTATLFERLNGDWNKLGNFYVNLSSDMSVGRVREELSALLDTLGDCRVAAGAGITGVLFHLLDSRGYAVFETADISPDTLDGILADLAEAAAAEAQSDVPRRPAETETPGVYALDLIQLQEAYPGISSKQALRDFLETAPFDELRLTCAHVPPWLESGPYDISSSPSNGALKARIRKKTCIGG